MKFSILTLFPEMFAPLRASILQRGAAAGVLEFAVINFRDYAGSKHKNVDDTPYGGGSGMVLKPEPLFQAVRDLPAVAAGARRVVLLTPQGEVFTQHKAEELAAYEEIVLICGHYEGFDERVRSLAQEEISIGDYVLTGGEAAAWVVVEAVARLAPGVLGSAASAGEDSHTDGLLEYPQYTRPPEFEGLGVPEVLLSGNHEQIRRWRRKESLRRTFLRRPDLAARATLTPEDYALLEELAAEEDAIRPHRERWAALAPSPKRGRRRKEAD